MICLLYPFLNQTIDTFVLTTEKKKLILESHINVVVANPSSPTITTGLGLHRCDLPLLHHKLAAVLVDKI